MKTSHLVHIANKMHIIRGFRNSCDVAYAGYARRHWVPRRSSSQAPRRGVSNRFGRPHLVTYLPPPAPPPTLAKHMIAVQHTGGEGKWDWDEKGYVGLRGSWRCGGGGESPVVFFQHRGNNSIVRVGTWVGCPSGAIIYSDAKDISIHRNDAQSQLFRGFSSFDK